MRPIELAAAAALALAPAFLAPIAGGEPLAHDADLAVDLVLADPDIAQPIEAKLDEHGRLWVVEYRQYPKPAGLTERDRDEFWRVRYDRELPPPPYAEGSPFRGRDRISVHEDIDGDGVYESHRTFLDGLNLTTSVAFDAGRRGGVWVLSPPHLLFYTDADGDLTPDGPPEVHLTGFGIEDSHAIANSLTWGPDGWLYGANGSTCSIAVTAPLATPGAPPVRRRGQLVWRYHPGKGFEVFAEGGGNTFGLEIDAAGNLFSGHNWGNTRGFHFVDGGYFRKNFGKHGGLANPHAYGFLDAMPHPPVERFTHHFVRYDAAALPPRFRGNLVALDVLHRDLALSEITPVGSTFRTRDLSRPVRSDGDGFSPVDLALAFDGSLLIADWADSNVNHYRNHEGDMRPSTGRIYRLRAKGQEPGPPPDFSTERLLDRIADPNRAVRRTALRLIRQRDAAELLDGLEALARGPAPVAFDAYAAARAVADLDRRAALDRRALTHPDPSLRRLAVAVADPADVNLAAVARAEDDPGVLVALAGRSRRLPPGEGAPIAAALSGRHGLADDPYFPLALWWAVERQLSRGDAAATLAGLDRGGPLFDAVLAPRILRWAVAQDSDFGRAVVADLLVDVENPGPLFAALVEAAAGSPVRSFGGAIDAAVRGVGDAAPLPLRVRLGTADPAAVVGRLPSLPGGGRDAVLGVIEDLGDDAFLPGLLDLATRPDTPAGLRSRLFGTLGRFDSPRIAARLLGALPDFAPAPDSDTAGDDARAATVDLLASRPAWAAALLDALDAGVLAAGDVSALTVNRMRLHDDAALRTRLAARWPAAPGDPAEAAAALERWSRRLAVGGRGDPGRGAALFTKHCAACHRLHGAGREVGPDLTSYQRSQRDQMLLAIVAPSAEIREGYETATALLADGSVLTGLLMRQDDAAVELKDVRGNVRTLPRDGIFELAIGGASLMPDRLLDLITDQQVRDLFAYLESGPPLPAGDRRDSPGASL